MNHARPLVVLVALVAACSSPHAASPFDAGVAEPAPTVPSPSPSPPDAAVAAPSDAALEADVRKLPDPCLPPSNTSYDSVLFSATISKVGP